MVRRKKGDYQNYSYEIEEFKGVIDIPSSIDGAYYSTKVLKYFFTKKYLKSVIYQLFKNKTVEQLIDERVRNNQIISIQEHTSPVRTDGKIQYPNIVTDKDNLRYLLKYLKKYNLWYATGSEIADYYYLYTKTKIEKKYHGKYTIKTDVKNIGKELSVKVTGKNNNKIKINDKIINPIGNNKGEIFNIYIENIIFDIEVI